MSYLIKIKLFLTEFVKIYFLTLTHKNKQTNHASKSLFYFLFSHTGFKFSGNSPGSFPTRLPSILLKAPLFDFADPLVSSFVAFPTSTVGAVNSVLSVNWPYTIFSSPRTTYCESYIALSCYLHVGIIYHS